MLEVMVPGQEFFDESKMEFIETRPTKLQLEHSLVSISKWESKWHKAFLGHGNRTREESLDYIRCMTINRDVDPMVYRGIPDSIMRKINDYIDDPMTATTFSENEKKGGKQIITSELLYYYMTALNIPFECQKWHLNRLLVLIRICSIKNQPPKKMSKGAVRKQHAELNAMRRARTGSKG